MTPELFVIGGGVVLLVLAALGGGIEVKEVKVPQMSFASRALSAIAGIALVSIGIYLKVPSPPPQVAISTPTTVAQLSAPEPATVGNIRFTITDRLDNDQLHESIEVFLEGKKAGVLSISEASPAEMLEIGVPTAGDYQYRLSGSLREQKDGKVEVYALTGAGMLQATKGASYHVRIKRRENGSAIVFLQAEP